MSAVTVETRGNRRITQVTSSTMVRLTILTQPVCVTLATQGITRQFEPIRGADDLVGSMTIAADGCLGIALC